MSANPEVVNTVLAQLQARRNREEAALLERRQRVFEQVPALHDINSKLLTTLAALLTLPTDANAQQQRLDELRARYFSLQAERNTLLRTHGYPETYLEPTVHCAVCNDNGTVDGKLCACAEALCVREEKKRLSFLLDLQGQTFDQFQLHYYGTTLDPTFDASPRDNAEGNLRYCRHYAATFSRNAESLLLIGPPGLGKTFLSAAIAGEVASAGFSVVYDSMTTIISTLEREKFERQDQNDGSGMYLHCDLLILDDLGTEMSTPFAQSALYTLVNHRLTSGLPTIVSTNLAMDELTRRYSRALVSRLRALYHTLFFFGDDIRPLVRQNRQNSAHS